MLNNSLQNFKRSAFLWVGAFLFALISGFTQNMSENQTSPLRYLALGDSYTIGEAVEQPGTFPFQLANRIEKATPIHFSEIKVVAKTGWTTNELQEGIKRAKPKGPYDLVTLLIGVNNQYRGYELGQYQKEFAELLHQAIGFAGNRADRVIVVAIPDYGCTPFGAEMAEKIDRELKVYNDIAQEISQKAGVAFVDIFPISKKAAHDASLIAEDKLHPSASMYTLWTEAIFPIVLSKLKH